jgi:hypothetical protein
MKKRWIIHGWIMMLALISASSVSGERVTTKWGGAAGMIYDTGFMHMLKNHPDGVCLFDMELIQNDAPGAGRSEKGVTSDVIWGETRARKILYLDDPRAYKAFIVFWVYRQGKYPLHFEVNGNLVSCENWSKSKSREVYRWIEFPVDWLKKGRNTIEIFSPEAASSKEGWEFYIARADEFEAGGGDPADVGKTSFKSFNGGESWKESPFGPLGKTRAEYTVRISFDRFVSDGWFATPVIDLWKGGTDDFIVRQHIIRLMKVSMRSDVPEGTTVEYYFRKGVDPNPFSDKWSPYELIGTGDSVELDIEGNTINRRYVQFRAVLSTTNPLKSPVVKSMHVTAELEEPFPVPLHENIVVLDVDNPPIKYPSVEWEWEPWNRPEFEELRKRENTDGIIEGSLGDFDAQVKLLDYATKRWRWVSPMPEYPGWDALSIADRIDNLGGGGMCIQFNLFLGGLYMAYGWQSRLVNIVGHEVCEVWNDEFGKWIYVDASYVNHYAYDPKTAEPLNMLELHNLYTDYYFPDRPIDWMNDFTGTQPFDEENHPVRRGSLTHHKKISHNGFTHAAFMRIVPRNNYYEKPYPMPLSHGSSTWPWDGYINWYDEKTPPKRQYTWHTDRPRDMWPDLNKVHVDATQGFGNDRLFLRFETYTPNFSHFEVNHNGRGWEELETDHWTWFLGSGRNTLSVRTVNKLGAKGKLSIVVLNHADAPLGEYIED